MRRARSTSLPSKPATKPKTAKATPKSAPKKAGTSASHGAPLGEDELRAAVRAAIAATGAKDVKMAGRIVDRMSTLIDDILYLQSIEQGNVRPDAYPVHLGPLVLDAVEDVIGPNVLCWTTNFFIKEAANPAFVSWHLDRNLRSMVHVER